jgi:hypothetical protein
MNMPITVRLATKADIKQSLSSRCTADFEPAYDRCGSNPDSLLGDRTSASAECRHGPPVTALNLGGLRHRIEAALMPDDVVDVRPLRRVRRCGPVIGGSRV